MIKTSKYIELPQESFYNHKQSTKLQPLEYYINKLPIFLSDTDIKRYLGNGFPIHKYSILDDIKTIDEILPNDNDCCILLIENQYNSGHFVGLGRRGNNIIQFDSYGSTIDGELKYIQQFMKRILGMQRHALSTLIRESNMKTEYNKIKYQSTKKILGKESSICGRAAILFCQLFKMGYTLGDIKRMIDVKREQYEEKYNTKLPYDLVITMIISEP